MTISVNDDFKVCCGGHRCGGKLDGSCQYAEENSCEYQKAKKACRDVACADKYFHRKHAECLEEGHSYDCVLVFRNDEGSGYAKLRSTFMCNRCGHITLRFLNWREKRTLGLWDKADKLMKKYRFVTLV